MLFCESGASCLAPVRGGYELLVDIAIDHLETHVGRIQLTISDLVTEIVTDHLAVRRWFNTPFWQAAKRGRRSLRRDYVDQSLQIRIHRWLSD